MKADIHPQYRDVVFHDVTSDFKILTRSTMSSKETVKWEDGEEYPLIKVEISSASHPFYTGKHKVIDTSGRIESSRSATRADRNRRTDVKRRPLARPFCYPLHGLFPARPRRCHLPVKVRRGCNAVSLSCRHRAA